MRQLLGRGADWGLTQHLLANVIDVLQLANWQRSDTKKTPRPDPFPRPGVVTTSPSGRTRQTPEQLHARLKAQQRRGR